VGAAGPQAARGLPEGTALALPTSGSTGRPKLVALSAAAIRASAAASAERLGGTGRWLAALPTDHIAGLNVVIRSLAAGAAPAVMPPGPFSARAFASACAALPPGPCYTSLVPTQLRRLAADGPGGIGVLNRFEAVLVGGAALDPELRRRVEAAGARLVETYGSAETCGGCVYDGRPLAGARVALSPGGTVQLAGPMLALGYAPAEGSRPGFFDRAGERWFASSDLGAWTPDGRLAIIGRADNAINSGGQTISPEPVEAVLRSLPAVADALVVGLPEPVWGELATALVVPDAGPAPTLEQLRRAVKARLGPAHAPRCLGVVRKLPALAPGKPDRRAAAALAARLDAAGALERLG
jgi:O-succinylbenzoic acid--CoA ligase